MARKRKKKQPISSGEVVNEESLPFAWVKYPNHCGTFFMYSQTQAGPWFFCKCCENLLGNLLELYRRFPPLTYADPLRMAPLDSLHVPSDVAEHSIAYREDPLSNLRFEKKLCHRCNLATPSRRYCHEMYGGAFDQSYGWYINQSYFRYGVDPSAPFNYIHEACPDEIQELIVDFRNSSQTIMEQNKKQCAGIECPSIGQTRKWVNKATKKLRNTFINFTREEFGIRKVGDGWVSETIVFNLVRSLFPDTEIIRHHRPEWLNGLEIDIFIPQLNCGIEYQGQQHYMPIKAWGGEEALKKLKARDKKKRKLCNEVGVKLLYVEYSDPLTSRFLKAKLEAAEIVLPPC